MRRAGALLLALALIVAACAASPPPPLASASVAPSEMPAATAPPAVAAASLAMSGRVERIASAPTLTRPAQPALTARFQAALVADHCTDRDLAALPATDIILTVLDRTYSLPASYVPPDLVSASGAGFGGASGTKLVRSVLLDDLAAMRAAAAAAGATLMIQSSYRSYASQAATFNSWSARLGYAGALLRSARPGHSEHQLGTAFDFTSPGWGDRVGDWAAETVEGAWMAAHGWEYGFVMSYPLGSQPLTCFSYEPWHYRWIGREAAAAQHASGLYPRQFLERYIGG